MQQTYSKGKRKKIVIDNENFYITITPNSVTATVPFENRPENLKLRQIIDSICETITTTLEELTDEQDRPTSQALLHSMPTAN